MRKAAVRQIDRAIKTVWKYAIKHDYETSHLLREDSLKCSFYHHLRNMLGDAFLSMNHLRVFTEFRDEPFRSMNLRPDLVVVELEEKVEGYLGENIKDILAVVELKYLVDYSKAAVEKIYKDFEKTHAYLKQLEFECQYYVGVIHEVFWDKMPWLDKRSTNHWANGKVTELNASFDYEGNMVFQVNSYNGLR